MLKSLHYSMRSCGNRSKTPSTVQRGALSLHRDDVHTVLLGSECMELGREAQVLEKYEIARQYFVEADSKGTCGSAYALGMMFKEGLGTAKDMKTAAFHFSTSAGRKNKGGMYELATLLFKNADNTVIENASMFSLLQDCVSKTQACTCFNFTCLQTGNVAAHYMLGICFYGGRGTTLNKSKAYEHFKHYKRCMFTNRAGCVVNGHDRYAFACYFMGCILLDGDNVHQNKVKAMTYLEEAAMLGHEEAKNICDANQ